MDVHCPASFIPLRDARPQARAEVGREAFADPAFVRLMQMLVPTIEVFPFRLIDGGAVVLRARGTLALAPLLGPAATALDSVFRSDMMIDHSTRRSGSPTLAACSCYGRPDARSGGRPRTWASL